MSDGFDNFVFITGFEELGSSGTSSTHDDVSMEDAANEMTHPLTGETINGHGPVDEVLQMYLQVEQQMRNLSNYQKALKAVIAERTQGETKTRHLIGERFKAAVTMPSETWENATLKEAWDNYPGLREQYLQIATIKPLLRKFDMLQRSAGEGEFAKFRQLVLSAKREPTAMPSIKVKPVEVGK